MIAVVLKTK